MTDSVTFEDIARAADRIRPTAARTPVMRSRLVNEAVGADVVFKCENQQRTGAFKFRGALNALSQFTVGQRRAGVVTFSSGNHGQAMARAAQLLEIPATIVMPADAPATKIDATRGYGGTVVFYDRLTENRESISATLADEHGLTVIPPFDHPHVIAGQGTAAKELIEEVGPLDALFVPLGGGGLLSGSAVSTRELSPDCRIYGVEPEAGNDGQRSLRSGSLVTIPVPQTIADGAQTTQLGDYTFEIIRKTVTDVVTVTDAELVAAMKVFAAYLKIIVEPTGALGLAGIRRQAADFKGQRLGVIVSGGNVDLQRYARLLSD